MAEKTETALPITEQAAGVIASKYPASMVAKLLTPREAWRPYPAASARAPWEALPAKLRQVCLAAGEKLLGTSWPQLKATEFLQFQRTGNRSGFQAPFYVRRHQLATLVLAEAVEGKGRFIDDVVNGIWTTCEESYWGLPAHLYMQREGFGLPDISDPTVDIFAADTAALLSWTSYLLASRLDEVSGLLRTRISAELQRRMLKPCLDRDDFFWMGARPGHMPLNNWAPWCCSRWLATALLMEHDPTARTRAVCKAISTLDEFLRGYGPDGGCDEGPGYWNAAGGALFDCLELLRSASNGQIDLYAVGQGHNGSPLIAEIGRYIYRAHIADRYFLNMGDCAAKVSVQGSMVYRFGKSIGDPAMIGLGAHAAQGQQFERELNSGRLDRQLAALFDAKELSDAKAFEPLLRDVWMKDTQLMAARSAAGSTAGLYLAAWGLHNGKSHNHNDAGNFVVYSDGRPALIDVGVETYSKKTFSPQRYEIWTMQSAYHNLPTINGVMQAAGRDHCATDVRYDADDHHASLSMELAGAYPADAMLKSWKRTVSLSRRGPNTATGGPSPDIIEVQDRYELAEARQPVMLSLMCAVPVDAGDPGRLSLMQPGDARPILIVEYDDQAYSATIEEIAIDDANLTPIWGKMLWRVVLRGRRAQLTGECNLRIHQ